MEEILRAIKTLTRYFSMRSGDQRLVYSVQEETCPMLLSKYSIEYRWGKHVHRVFFVNTFGLKISRTLFVYIDTKYPESSTVVVYKTIVSDSKLGDRTDVELFSLSELQYNIFENDLVPQSEVLSGEEKRLFVEFYRIRHPSAELPLISITDPLVRALNYKRGSLIKFYRTLPTRYTYVRCVS